MTSRKTNREVEVLGRGASRGGMTENNSSPYIGGNSRRLHQELLTALIESPPSSSMAEAFVNTLKPDCVAVSPNSDACHPVANLPRSIEHW